MLVRLGLALSLICFPALSQVQPARTYGLNRYVSVLDGQWFGIRYASDGNVYFASSTHSAHHGAAFFKYNPATQEVTMLAEDITKICGEDPQTNPQGKLHSDIVEANGWLYMSTHFSSELPGAYDKWTGAHVIGYQLSTGKFRDYGVVHPNYTSYAGIGVDARRHFLYVVVTGQVKGQVTYIYRIDTETGEKRNLGKVGEDFTSSFGLFVDRHGDVWLSLSGQNGDLLCVRGATGKIERFPNALPQLYLWNEAKVNPSKQAQSERFIAWMQPVNGDQAVFTLSFYGGMLYQFDSSRPIASAFQNIAHIGYTDLGLAVGNRRVYYYQRANRAYGHQGDQLGGNLKDFHLLSVALDRDHAITDHGLLRDQDGRLAWRAPGMQTDGKGLVFMIGDWWTLPGESGSKRYHYENGVESYVPLPRGEFFSVVDTSASLPHLGSKSEQPSR